MGLLYLCFPSSSGLILWSVRWLETCVSHSRFPHRRRIMYDSIYSAFSKHNSELITLAHTLSQVLCTLDYPPKYNSGSWFLLVLRILLEHSALNRVASPSETINVWYLQFCRRLFELFFFRIPASQYLRYFCPQYVIEDQFFFVSFSVLFLHRISQCSLQPLCEYCILPNNIAHCKYREFPI